VQDIRRLKTTSGFKILEGIGSQQAYITLNNAKPPLDDVKVRRAINHAVDKEAIIRNVYLGGGKVAQAVYANPTIDGYVPAGAWKFDQNAARALLDEAGWRMGPGGVRVKDGRPMQLELITRRGGSPGDYETSEIVQGMLKQVGIDVRLVVLESATFVPRVTLPRDRANYDMVYLTVGTFTGDIEYILQTFYHSSSAAPRYFNRAHYGNPVVDRLIEQSLNATTAKSRNSIYMGQIMRTVFNDAPILQLIDMPQELAVRDNVHGVFLEPAGNNWPAKYAWKSR
jgi:peptide/nickel transport system substrate-binding protein